MNVKVEKKKTTLQQDRNEGTADEKEVVWEDKGSHPLAGGRVTGPGDQEGRRMPVKRRKSTRSGARLEERSLHRGSGVVPLAETRRQWKSAVNRHSWRRWSSVWAPGDPHGQTEGHPR